MNKDASETPTIDMLIQLFTGSKQHVLTLAYDVHKRIWDEQHSRSQYLQTRKGAPRETIPTQFTLWMPCGAEITLTAQRFHREDKTF